MPYDTIWSKKIVVLTGELTGQEKIEIAQLQQFGYTVKEKKVSKNKEWYLKHLPNDEAREEFNKVYEDNDGGVKGFKAATSWAQKTYKVGLSKKKQAEEAKKAKEAEKTKPKADEN